MRQDGSFEARAAHNISHHRRTLHDHEEGTRAQELGITMISAARSGRIERTGSGVAAWRSTATRRRYRCVSRAKLAAYLANGG